MPGMALIALFSKRHPTVSIVVETSYVLCVPLGDPRHGAVAAGDDDEVDRDARRRERRSTARRADATVPFKAAPHTAPR